MKGTESTKLLVSTNTREILCTPSSRSYTLNWFTITLAFLDLNGHNVESPLQPLPLPHPLSYKHPQDFCNTCTAYCDRQHTLACTQSSRAEC